MEDSLFDKRVVISPTKKEVHDQAAVLGISHDRAEDFFHFYQSQGWYKSNGQPICHLRSQLFNWKKNQYKFDAGAGASPKKNVCKICGRQAVKQWSHDWLCADQACKIAAGWAKG